MRMISARIPAALLGLVAIVGCGPGSGGPMDTYKPSPVGGAMLRLPNDAGLVAIKIEAVEAARASKRRPRASKIVAVFFKSDGSTPMDPPPTEVVFEVEDYRSKSGGSRAVPLEADPTAPHRFASAPSSYPGGVEGKLRARINGEELEESFSTR